MLIASSAERAASCGERMKAWPTACEQEGSKKRAQCTLACGS
jgi:hypothetical protein